MPGSPEFPNIDMEFYETDTDILQNFITTVKTDGQFTEEYLILYDFATDLKYQVYINPGLIKYLLPFYLKTMEEAVVLNNKTAMDIYCAFNEALFFNRQNFISAMGNEPFNYIINEKYIKSLFKETKNLVYKYIGKEIASLFCEEIDRSFNTGIFYSRKKEFLEKISSAQKKEFYWDNTF
ncbi:MAG: hypothetical protein K1W24_08920 [Lachnospiraceae bacterium]